MWIIWKTYDQIKPRILLTYYFRPYFCITGVHASNLCSTDCVFSCLVDSYVLVYTVGYMLLCVFIKYIVSCVSHILLIYYYYNLI